MDFKALRAAKNKKAEDRVNSSGGKVDSSDWSPSEPLNTEAKTGMRPISRRAFKAGGKVDGGEAKTNLSRTPRGFSEKVGLANTNQKDANEERDGKKHVGGFARGGSGMKKAAERDIGEYVAGEEMPSYKAKSAGRKALKEMSTAEVRKKMGSNRNMERPPSGLPDMQDLDDRENDPRKFKKGGRVAKMGGGLMDPSSGEGKMPVPLDHSKAMPKPERSPLKPSRSELDEGNRLMLEDQRRQGDMTRRKAGGKVDKFEGSAKDEMQDKKLAAKRGMSMKEWEASKADDKHDAQKSMKGLKDGGKAMHHKDCVCKACGGAAVGKKDGGGLYANIHAKRDSGEKMRDAGDKGAPTAEDFKDAKRTARATGGRTKGKTNIVINVMPHTGEKDKPTGIMPPMEPPRIAGPAPMAPPPPAHVGLPPGLGAAMAGAAGAPMGPPPGGPGPMMPPMARKSGGKVYPIHTGAGGGQARLDKAKAYGLKQQ